MNRVLTLEEVLARPEGAKVWVEHNPVRPSCDWPDEVHVMHVKVEQDGSLALHNGYGPWIAVSDGDGFSTRYRVWSLPQPPTDDELAANPWPEV